jgi:hypothetical protein
LAAIKLDACIHLALNEREFVGGIREVDVSLALCLRLLFTYASHRNPVELDLGWHWTTLLLLAFVTAAPVASARLHDTGLTLLSRAIDAAVAAFGHLALITGVEFAGVCIVARFQALRDAVAASRDGAVVAATVVVVEVSVIADLPATNLANAIPAEFDAASTPAAVAGLDVPIVALLVGLDNPVAAFFELAGA